ncbi:iron carrier [Hyaloraphidium curvatum]|nr:iron carrier [Hyaloraphidium curvatum]
MSTRVLLGATFGLVAGLSVVSGAAVVAETRVPPPSEYSARASRYDQRTFAGRLGSMLTTMDPSTLLASNDAVRGAQKLLKDFDAGAAPKASVSELWAARKLRDSAVHPDTGEIVPRPFRMAGYVPYNGPVCVAMMISSSTPALLFWNWVNQSQNALVNYFNRNASSPTSNGVLAQSYATAVSCALLVAFSVSTAIKRSFDPATAKRMLTFVALPSSMVASSANAYIMRSPEISSGIAVVDGDGKPVAAGHRSSVAARKAVMETVYSRILLQLPVFFVPPVFMMAPPVAAAAAASPAVAITANTFVTLVGFGLGLPAAVAVFPQTGELAVKELEDGPIKLEAEARGLKSVFYNKGL